MRTLVLLRGSAGCGKSTWIEKNGLKPYTLCADDIRLLCQSPILQVNGDVGISQANDSVVWKTLFNLLEIRMQRGEFTVIDATNSKTSEINKYKEMCKTYRYRMYCVDFTDIPIDEVKRRNSNRIPLKRVPEEVIDKMYSRFETQKIPSGVTIIKPEELEKIFLKLYDLSSYKKVHHIGDIHGCNSVLQEYLKNDGGLKEDNFYIFTGDFIDRGIENVEVIKFLISIMDRPNVIMLEGNHEKWLWLYANDCVGAPKEFELITKIQIENSDIDKKDIRKLYRRLGQCAYYKYGDNIYLVTHAGLSTLPYNLSFVCSEQMIKGVGNYKEIEEVSKYFINNTPNNIYQIHGHRNTKNLPIQVNERVFNLEGGVEFGGHLRCVQIDDTGIHPIEIKNNIFKPSEKVEAEKDYLNNSMVNILMELKNNPNIQEKKFGNISSFNFTRKAFFDKIWDNQTIKARGLYIDTSKCKVVARAYEKFFNINERPETKLDILHHKLQFPVTAYVKENGFLGIVSYNEYEDDLLITSKSDMGGDFAKYLKAILYEKISTENIEKMKEYIKNNNVSFVFECIDIKNDPHIIEYPENKLFLLDIVSNDIEFKKYSYESLKNVGKDLGLIIKEKAYDFSTWHEFYDWYYEVSEKDYEYNGRNIEGFVIEDSLGFMVKLKLHYYNFWKFMRSLSHEVIRNGYTKKTSALTTPLANYYCSWVKKFYKYKDKNIIPKDIITLRKLFYLEYKDNSI